MPLILLGAVLTVGAVAGAYALVGVAVGHNVFREGWIERRR